MNKANDFTALGRAVVETELQAISALTHRIDHHFNAACEHLLHCKGRIVVIGMGKSGHVGNKIAATLASTGTPAFFVHPGEASHGDLGMITPQDVVLVISYSGNTPEIVTLLPLIKRFNIPMIAMTGNAQSTIAEAATVHLDVSVEKEACPHNLAPTASTTTALVMGDALAIALLDARGFSKEDFALSHPGGTLGKRLLLHVNDIMRTGKDIPRVKPDATLSTAILEVSSKKLGFTAVTNDNDDLLGVFTDGDLRRALDKKYDIDKTSIDSVMTKGGVTAHEKMLAIEVAQIMEKHKITGLVVCNDKHQVVGALNIHDLFQAGVI